MAGTLLLIYIFVSLTPQVPDTTDATRQVSFLTFSSVHENVNDFDRVTNAWVRALKGNRL